MVRVISLVRPEASLREPALYVLTSDSSATNNFVLTANPNYWGGPYAAEITPTIQTIDINYVPSQATRDIRPGKCCKIRPSDNYRCEWRQSLRHCFEERLANKWYDSIDNSWDQHLCPYSQFATDYEQFSSNVTNIFSGDYFTFQPFADIRFRTAFADSVNMTEINNDVNNRLGLVANELIPPQIPPVNSYNASLPTSYGYNLTAVQVPTA